jgi:hypothetical protein
VALIVSALLLAAAIMLVWVLSSTWYRVADTELQIRCGPLRWKLALDSVEQVAPSRSVLSGPGLSFDRLRVVYRGASSGVLVSPLDRDGFLDCLVSRSRHLRREGDHLVRVT